MGAHRRLLQEESRSELTDLVAQALELRRWAVALLARRIEPPAAVERFPRVSLEAWRLFLAAEVVALPLSRRLGESIALLAAEYRVALEQATRGEMQRVMSARAQLADIDRMADALGVEPVVLKGGVAAIEGNEPVDLGDVDLLLDTNDWDAVSQALVERGFVRDVAIPLFMAAGAVPVELHTELDVGDGVASAAGIASQRLTRFRRLRRLTPVAHIAYVVQHSTTHHAVRRGHLRDVMLVAGGLAGCSPEEVRELERALSRAQTGTAYADMLRFSQAMLATDDASAIADPFTKIAAAKYAMAGWPDGSGAPFPLMMHHVPFFVASAEDGWRVARSYLTGEVRKPSPWYSAAIARRSPRVAEWLAMLVRTPYRVTALATACAAAIVIRRRYSSRWSR